MLTMVEAITTQGESLVLPLADTSDGYVIKDIDGLDPVKANIVSSSFAHLDGEQYQASRREKRNIVITLGLEPDFAIGSVRELRNNLYKYFMPKMKTHLIFYSDDMPPVHITGRVESMDSKLFTKEPEAVMSLLCLQPDFYDPQQMLVEGVSTSNDLDTVVIDYPGTVDTGFLLELYADRAMNDFNITNEVLGEIQQKLEFVAPFVAGDVVRISTVPGNKYATITSSGGVLRSILYGVSPYSDWVRLVQGTNNFRVEAKDGGVPYSLYYTSKYGGI